MSKRILYEQRYRQKCGRRRENGRATKQPHVGGTYGNGNPALLGDKALMFSGGDKQRNGVF
jgi:hypothetical protein